MPVGGAARHEEQVDAAGVRQTRVVFRGVGGIGNPDVMVGDAGVGRQLLIDRRLNLAEGEAETAVVRIHGTGDEAALAVRIQILVHHHDDEVREVVVGLGGAARQRLIDGARRAPARATQEEAAAPAQRRPRAVEDLAGQRPAELLRACRRR